jgi:hypothetical protein
MFFSWTKMKPNFSSFWILSLHLISKQSPSFVPIAPQIIFETHLLISFIIIIALLHWTSFCTQHDLTSYLKSTFLNMA